MRLQDCPTTDVSVTVGAPVARVWELVTDITLPPRFTSEVQSVEWIDGPARLGATFRGRNHHAQIGEWESFCTVVAFDPGREFGWAVSDAGNPAAVWTFLIEPAGDGVDLIYRMQLGPGPSGLSAAIARRPDRETDIIQRRMDEQRVQMERLLAGIKELAEGACG